MLLLFQDCLKLYQGQYQGLRAQLIFLLKGRVTLRRIKDQFQEYMPLTVSFPTILYLHHRLLLLLYFLVTPCAPQSFFVQDFHGELWSFIFLHNVLYRTRQARYALVFVKYYHFHRLLSFSVSCDGAEEPLA